MSRPSTSSSTNGKKDVDARHRRQVYAVCAGQTAMAGHDETTNDDCWALRISSQPSSDERCLHSGVRKCRELVAALRRQQSDDLGVGPRAAEQKTLSLVTAFGAQAAQLGFGLDAFGGDDDAKPDAKRDDRTHD